MSEAQEEHDDQAPAKVRFGLRFKLSIGLVLIIAVVVAALNTYNLLSHRNVRVKDAENSAGRLGSLVASSIVTQMAEHPLDSGHMRKLTNDVATTALVLDKNEQDLAFIMVADTEGNVITGRARPKLTIFPGNKYYTKEDVALAQVAKLKGALGRGMKTKRIALKRPGRDPEGYLYVGISLASIKWETQRDLFLNAGILAVVIILLLMYSSLALRTMVIRPLHDVVDAMRAARDGNLDHELPTKRKDEMGVLANTYNFMIRGLREREQLEDAFSRYVSSQVYDKMKGTELTLTGEMRNATILFSDIRSFTSLSERLTPAQVVAMLNEYFDVMVDIVFKYEGFLNKFIGDALMAIYNVPIDQDEPEMRAVRTAFEMVQDLRTLNAKREARGDFPIKIGIGVNTGPVVAGNIGHMKRLEYTVIGDAVNLAQRIESQTKVAGAELLISETTYAVVADRVQARELDPVKVKGKEKPVRLYAIDAVTG